MAAHEAPVTRGFEGRRRAPRPDRLPPGQYDAGTQWPILSTEPTPALAADDWTLRIDGRVGTPGTLTWADLQTLPRERFTTDLHCVTTWSRLDTSFVGVSLDHVLAPVGVADDATYAFVGSTSGYTTNLPLADLLDQRSWLVWEADGAPLTPDHGGPVRLLVPHLYLWKSAKWVNRITLRTDDEPGFWERGGYHDRGDPWLEQRYQGDP